ncbi:MAG: EcsC family protein, partial [Paracoccaceae bacterium]|nr:EcsC family protein [Paracoccaceae bacterium]
FAYGAAKGSHRRRPGGDLAHRAAAAALGALGGLGGLPSALAELPVTTTTILRSLQEIARFHGEDPADEATRLACLQVLGAGGPLAEDDGTDFAFLGARITLTGATLQGLIAQVAPRFAAALAQKLAAKAVPVLGAAAGAAVNLAFARYYQEMAHVHFGLRRLARVGALHATAAFRSEVEAARRLRHG